MFNFTGKRPEDLGVTDGKLKPAPKTPNGVSSQAPAGSHAISPLNYQGTAVAAHRTLKELLASMPEAHLISDKPDYLYFEFKTAFFGFVDDVEFYFGEPGVVHMRSASRLGRSDFGVNRSRLERIRSLFEGH